MLATYTMSLYIKCHSLCTLRSNMVPHKHFEFALKGTKNLEPFLLRTSNPIRFLSLEGCIKNSKRSVVSDFMGLAINLSHAHATHHAGHIHAAHATATHHAGHVHAAHAAHAAHTAVFVIAARTGIGTVQELKPGFICFLFCEFQDNGVFAWFSDQLDAINFVSKFLELELSLSGWRAYCSYR